MEGTPGACIYVKGSNFPYSIILSPMVLFHHFINNYEEIMRNVLNVIKQNEYFVCFMK